MRAGQDDGAAPGHGILRGWMERNARVRPEHGYLQDARGSRRVTYGALWARCQWWEEHLRSEGLAPGATVALDCCDHLDYAVTAVALLGAGQVVVPLDPRAPQDEVRATCRVARPVAFVHQPHRLQRSDRSDRVQRHRRRTPSCQ